MVFEDPKIVREINDLFLRLRRTRCWISSRVIGDVLDLPRKGGMEGPLETGPAKAFESAREEASGLPLVVISISDK